MDFNHNGEDPSNYVNKTKKQAKRLLQLTKKSQNNVLEVSSLMDAQNVLAKINGFPDWHSLNSYVLKNNKSKNVDENTISKAVRTYISDQNEYPKLKYGIHYRVKENVYESVFNLNVSLKRSEMISKIINIIDKFKFASNLGFHEINFHFINKNEMKKIDGYDILHGVEKYSETLDVNSPQSSAINLIFLTDKKIFDEKYIGSLDIEDVHIKFVLSIIEAFKYFMPISLKNKQEIFKKTCLVKSENKIQLEVEKNKRYEFLANTDLLNSAFFAINYILENKINCELKFSLDGIISYYFENNKAPLFIKETLMKTGCTENLSLEIPKCLEANEHGLGFYNVLSQSISYIDLSLKNKDMSVSGVFYQGKSRAKSANELMSYFVTDRHLGDFNSGVKTAILTKNYNSEFLLNLLNNRVSNKTILLGEGNASKLPNPLMLPIGINILTDSNIERIYSLLISANCVNFKDDVIKKIFISIFKNMNSFMGEANLLFSNFIPNLITEGDYNKILNFLNMLDIKKDEISIIETIRLLKLKKQISLARLLQSEYTFTFHDLHELILKMSDDDFINMIFENIKEKDETEFDVDLLIKEKIIYHLDKMRKLFNNEVLSSDFDEDCDLYILNINSDNPYNDYLSKYAFYVIEMFIQRNIATIEENHKSFIVKKYMDEFKNNFYSSFSCKYNSGFMLVIPEIIEFEDNLKNDLSDYIRNSRKYNHSVLYSMMVEKSGSINSELIYNYSLLDLSTSLFLNVDIDTCAYDGVMLSEGFISNPIVKAESKKENNWITLDFNRNGKTTSLLRFNKK